MAQTPSAAWPEAAILEAEQNRPKLRMVRSE
jgi:hypothetical protein